MLVAEDGNRLSVLLCCSFHMFGQNLKDVASPVAAQSPLQGQFFMPYFTNIFNSPEFFTLEKKPAENKQNIPEPTPFIVMPAELKGDNSHKLLLGRLRLDIRR